MFVVTAVRFEFFDGKKNYTVEHSSGINTWYIFKDTDRSGALHFIKRAKRELINENNAKFHLDAFLELLQK